MIVVRGLTRLFALTDAQNRNNAYKTCTWVLAGLPEEIHYNACVERCCWKRPVDKNIFVITAATDGGSDI